MKKKILFLVLAIFAAAATFGQATHTSNIKDAVTCTNDALRPMAGVPYTYSVTTSPNTGTYTWWATTVPNFISAGVLQNTAANVRVSPDVVPTTAENYDSPNSTSNSVELIWGTDILAAAMGASGVPTFVSVYYNNSTAGCADNLKVFQVEPINAFMVDIKNIDHTSLDPIDTNYGSVEDQCYDKVQGASWSGGAMIYDYGTNILYFEVVASNFTGTWTPTFTLGTLLGDQAAVIEWAYNTSFGRAVTVTSGFPSVTDVTTDATDTSDGVSIFVKVTVSNKTFEGLANQNISLAVTGTNSASQRDVLADDCGTPATLRSNAATQTLNLRPTITSTSGAFEQP